MSERLGRLALAGLLAFTLGCEPTTSVGASAAPLPSASATAAPSSLPTADEERTITEALVRSGARVSRVFPSKFDWLFGSAGPRAATFEVTFEGYPTWADVHVLERISGDIVACSGQPMTSLAGTFSVALDGRLQSLNSSVTGSISSGAMYFAASDRYFVMTPELHLRDELLRVLDLTVPSCRVPVDLPVFPWEREVVEALGRAGIQLTLIGGSKFEALLGERLQARAFIDRAGSGGAGADVLFMDRPLTGVRVCYSRASSGLQRDQIFTGGRLVSEGEGSQMVRFSVSDRYFVQAFGSAFHEALMRGLGTKEPPC